MPIRLTVGAAALLLAAAAAAQEPPATLRHCDKYSIEGLRIGMTLEQVRAKFPQYSRWRQTKFYHVTREIRGRRERVNEKDILLQTDHDLVARIYVVDFGVRADTMRKKYSGLFGEPTSTENDGWSAKWLPAECPIVIDAQASTEVGLPRVQVVVARWPPAP